MKIPRGYQANATLSDGSLFTIGGSWSGGRGNKDGELYTTANGWQVLNNVTAVETVEEGTTGYSGEGVYRRDNHAWIWTAPNGRVFHAGPGENMHWIDVAGNGNVDDAGVRGTDQYAMNGNAVMYDIGKIMTCGGAPSYSSGQVSSIDAYTIDINGNSPVINRVGNLNYNRTMQNSVVLPTGEVVVVGGLRDAEIFTDANARLVAEMWNPATGNFRPLASMQIPRTYHSAAILMADGRVLVGGGGLCNNCDDNLNHSDVEIYSPPYLFNTNGSLATRPAISSAPTVANHNGSVSVSTNTTVNDFVLVRLGSATHSVNNEQRRVPLNFTNTGGTNYSLSIPNASIAIPGYYMLFAIKNGVPSVSKAIRVGNGEIGSGGNTDQSRYISQNGNIPGVIQAEYYDNGGQGVAYNDDGNKNGETSFRPGDKVDANVLSGSNYKVGWTAAGEWLEYTVDAQAGTYDIVVTASSSNSNPGDLQVSLDGVPLGTASIAGTGSWFTTQNFTISDVTISGGSDRVLRLTVVNGQNFDIDKVTFVAQTSCPDADIDGVCDADDQCPGFNDALIGTSCNDGNVSTINDVYTADCTCAGTPTSGGQIRYTAQTSNIPGTIEAEYYDFGGQGVAFNDNNTRSGNAFRANDNVDIGDLANGGYTIGWTANGEWLEYTVNVIGGTYDMVLTASAGNILAGGVQVSLDGQTLGTIDVDLTGNWAAYQSFTVPNVAIAGGTEKVLRLTVVDGAKLNIDKIAFIPNGPACTPGTACNDGDACTINDTFDDNCDCIGSVADTDNDGTCDADDVCPNFNDFLIGTACDDGNAATVNDVYTTSCTCSGVPASGNDFWLEAECAEVGSAWNLINDDGASNGQALTYTGGNSTGSAPTAASARVRFSLNISQAGSYEVFVRSVALNTADDSYWVRANNGGWIRYNYVNGPSYPSSYAWDQVGNWTTGSDNTPVSFNLPTGTNTIDFAYRENGIRFDKVFVSLSQGQPCGQGGSAENCDPACTPGTACNDGDACTVNDVFDSSCGCAGTFADSDNDGICNDDDQCPNFNDGLIGTTCNDGDASTVNDVYTSDCVCAGTPDVGSGTITLDPIHDAYLQGSTRFNTDELRVENGNRVSFLQFDLSSIPGAASSVELTMEVGSDGGNGVIQVHKGSSNNWTETNISNANKPSAIQQLGVLNTTYSSNGTYTWSLNPTAFTGSTISLLVIHASGNDVSFKSDENSDAAGRPQLVIDYGGSQRTAVTPGAVRIDEDLKAPADGTIRVFPNPFLDELTLELPLAVYQNLKLIDVTGRVVLRRVIGAETTRLVLPLKESVPAGLYLLRLHGKEEAKTIKLIRRE